MAALTIRNLTAHPLELVSVERFEGERVSSGVGLLGSVARAITGFLNATDRPAHETRPRGDAVESRKVALALEPFGPATPAGDGIRAPAPGTGALEVLRLTFRTGGHAYQADLPSRSGRAAPLARLDDGPLDLAAVYLPAAALVALFSSARLHAWMAELRDDWPLTLLSLPGTHNSPACYTALPSVRCQAVAVPDQLRNGVRFLDVRLSVNPGGDALALVHSAFPVSLTGTKYLADLLSHVYAFLDENPSEAVLVSFKREGTGKGTDAQLGQCLDRAHAARAPHRWWTDPAIPTLGQARGRLVAVRRFALDDDLRRRRHDGRGWGIDAHEWPDNCDDGGGGGGNFRIQDFYDVAESAAVDAKIRLCCRQLERAAHQAWAPAPARAARHRPHAPAPPFFVNFLSGSNFFNATCWPERVAARVNPAVVEYLCATHGDAAKGALGLDVGHAATGIVITDWVGADGNWDLVRCIVAMNARLQLKQ